MVSQPIKDLYYGVAYACSWLLLPIYSLHYRLFRSRIRNAHIGCGQYYIADFINIDGNIQNRCDYWIDVRAGLPFASESIEFIYSNQMLEHLHIWEAIEILREFARVLKKGAYVRLTLPDFRFAVDLFTGSEKAEPIFPREFRSKSGQAINFLFCDGQHKYAYTDELIAEIGLSVGFAAVDKAPEHDPHLPPALTEPAGCFTVNLLKR